MSASRRKPRWFEGDKLPLAKAFQIGCCQVLSIIPGVSRSGATILGGEIAGRGPHGRDHVHLLSGGADHAGRDHPGAAPQGAALLSHGQGTNIAIGFVVSFVVAFFVIGGFLHIVDEIRPQAFRLVPHRRRAGAVRLSGACS